MFSAELDYVATQSRLFQSYAHPYRAMGGGWVEDAQQYLGKGVSESGE